MSNYLLLYDHYGDHYENKEGETEDMSMYSPEDEWIEDPKKPNQDIRDRDKKKSDCENDQKTSETKSE